MVHPLLTSYLHMVWSELAAQYSALLATPPPLLPDKVFKIYLQSGIKH